MSNINPQYTFDNTGNVVGVFLPIEDWNAITEKLHLDLPKWQKDMIDRCLIFYKNNPADTLNWILFLNNLTKRMNRYYLRLIPETYNELKQARDWYRKQNLLCKTT